MGVFVSYSSRDKDRVTQLTQDLQDADEQVWLDQRLAGGDAWWRAILEQIRGCDVFVFALSQNSIESKPCRAELHYAQQLGLPILPVQVGSVDSMQLNPLATVQTMDYRASTSSAAMRLLAALNRLRAQRQPLPSPLPAEPPVPFEYLIRLFTTIAGPDYLSPPEQAALLAQLQLGLREDGGHDAARSDILALLRKLRDREDVTYRTRTDVDTILASIDAGTHPVNTPEQPILTAAATPGPSYPTTPPLNAFGAATSRALFQDGQHQGEATRAQDNAQWPSERRSSKAPRRLALVGAVLLVAGFVLAVPTGAADAKGETAQPWETLCALFLIVAPVLLAIALGMAVSRRIKAYRARHRPHIAGQR